MKQRIALLLLLSWIFAQAIHSQTVYHLQYTLPGESQATNNDAFFVKMPDGTGFVRVKYIQPATQTSLMVDLSIREEYITDAGGEIDTNYAYYKGINPTFINGKDNGSFIAPVFWFKRNPGTGLFDPWGVNPVSVSSPPDSPNFLLAELSEWDNLSRDFVLQYFAADDIIFQNLFQNAHRELSTLEKNIKLHLVAVANNNDEEIGISCYKDLLSTEESFGDIAKTLGIEFKVTKIFGDQYNKQNVLNFIAGFRPAPNDIVIFYYSGHGFRKTTDRRPFPYLDLRAVPRDNYMTESLNIMDIFEKIKAKGARVNLVISDCCNTEPEKTNAKLPDLPHLKSSGYILSQENCRKLFMDENRMSMLMTAADVGEKASSNDNLGGFFTHYLLATLESQLSIFQPLVSWDMVIKNAKAQTIYKASHTYCEKPYIPQNICKQTPRIFLLAQAQ